MLPIGSAEAYPGDATQRQWSGVSATLARQPGVAKCLFTVRQCVARIPWPNMKPMCTSIPKVGAR